MDDESAPIANNPFAALFPSVQDAQLYSKWKDEFDNEESISLPEQVMDVSKEKIIKLDDVENTSSIDKTKDDLIERIFLISTNHECYSGDEMNSLPAASVLLSSENEETLSQSIEKHLFERLLLSDPEKYIISRYADEEPSEEEKNEATEARPLMYMVKCYNRLIYEQNNVSPILLPTIKTCKELIIRNLATSLINPELFKTDHSSRSSLHGQLYDLLTANDCSSSDSPVIKCLYEVADFILNDNPNLLETAFIPLMEIIYNDMVEDILSDPGLIVHLTVILALASHSSLAEILLSYVFPEQSLPRTLVSRPKTILELALTKSCLITPSPNQEYEFFDRVASMGASQVENEEYHIHNKLDGFHSALLGIFRQFLKHENARDKLLSWIGEIIAKNAFLAKMWTHERWDVFMGVNPSDALFFNLSAVLVRLCLPFCADKTVNDDNEGLATSSKPSNPKFLRIDPTYCLATKTEDRKKMGVHGKDMHKDTCLQASSNDDEPINVSLSGSYNFITECFFLTHRALYLSVHGLIKKFYKLNRSMNRLEGLYRDIRSTRTSSDDVQPVIDKFERGMRIYLTTKAALTEPAFIEACIRLHATTNQFLVQVAVSENMSTVAPVVLPFPKDQPTSPSLYYLPEYIVENISDIVIFLWRFAQKNLYIIDLFIHDFLLMIAVYMGSKNKMSNPHLRASLAEVLQVILPLPDRDDGVSNKKEIFDNFSFSPFLAISTLQLFVDIEFTGDPHQFEQKFNYRQPLYKIMRFMWDREECRNEIRESVKTSITDIDDPVHPLFLQFTNLLLNDSIFLLDEAMGYLTQIKTLEREKMNGEWDDLNARDKQQKEAELQQLGMLAKYHNVLSNDTMDTLVYLTTAKEVKDLFCHSLLADRVAAMLDDFLLKLVGPKMGVLRVRDLSKYAFKPKVLVADICKIYVNLCSRDEFCRAISRDGRSYSAKLFPMACQVLRRIGDEDMMQKMLEVSEKIKIISKQEEEEEEIYVDAPDEFYDSLMSTLMRDPVILPLSRQVVDRSTISRHLMSDPTDPFNRSPLTMKDVIPNTELKNKINQWLEEKRNEKSQQ